MLNTFLSSQQYSKRTVRILEQIMSVDKYPCIFSRQIEAIVYIHITNKSTSRL